MTDFSQAILQRKDAQNPRVLERIAIAKRRIRNILDREIVAHPKTLEQKISEQGPNPQRVNPHLVGLAITDLLKLGRLCEHHHAAIEKTLWYSNLAPDPKLLASRLDELAPLYASITKNGFGNLTGDALEVIVYKCLDRIFKANPRYAYLGSFDLNEPKNEQGRYRKRPPPKTVSGSSTEKEADFVQFGHNVGPLCIECKNHREWTYPHSK